MISIKRFYITWNVFQIVRCLCVVCVVSFVVFVCAVFYAAFNNWLSYISRVSFQDFSSLNVREKISFSISLEITPVVKEVIIYQEASIFRSGDIRLTRTGTVLSIWYISALAFLWYLTREIRAQVNEKQRRNFCTNKVLISCRNENILRKEEKVFASYNSYNFIIYHDVLKVCLYNNLND